MPPKETNDTTQTMERAHSSMTWVYPIAGHQTWEAGTFVLGALPFVSSQANANQVTLTMTQTAPSTPDLVPVVIPVSPESGLFAYNVPLRPGVNTITLTVSVNGESVMTETRSIERCMQPDLAQLWTTDLTGKYSWAWPAEPTTLVDTSLLWEQGLKVGFWGPEYLKDPKVSISLGGQHWELPLFPMGLADDTAQSQFAQRHQIAEPLPMGGIWYGTAIPGALLRNGINERPVERQTMALDIAYSAIHGDRAQLFTSRGSFELVLTQQPLPWYHLKSTTTAKRGGGKGVPLTPAWVPNTMCQEVLRQGDWVAVSAFSTISPSAGRPSWQQLSDWVWLPAEALVPSDTMGWVIGHDMQQRFPNLTQARAYVDSDDEGWILIPLPLPFPVPISWHAEQHQLAVTLDGVNAMSEWWVLPDEVQALGLSSITWQPSHKSGQTRFKLTFTKPLWGVRIGYDARAHEFVLSCRTTVGLLQALENRPFRLLVDAGHGGDEIGATAMDATPEKAINLALAKACFTQADQAPSQAIEVLLTRDEDKTVSLAQRVEDVLQKEPDLILSLHHNALPDGRDPLAEHGWSTFYWHGFAQPMAVYLQKQMTQTDVRSQSGWMFADYGVIQTDFAMTRLSVAPAILMECGFLTHPKDAARCLDATHPNRVAQLILASVHEYLVSLRAEELG